MKKCIALLLVFLLSMASVVAVSEVDFSSYTDAELRDIRKQLRYEMIKRGTDEENIEAVCVAFAEYMQVLEHPVEYLDDFSGDFQRLRDTQLNSEDLCVATMGPYEVMLMGDLASNEAYIRDCMVSMAMAVAQVEGVEIFSNEVSTAMRNCKKDLPDGFYSEELRWYWGSPFEYIWKIHSHNGTTVISVI